MKIVIDGHCRKNYLNSYLPLARRVNPERLLHAHVQQIHRRQHVVRYFLDKVEYFDIELNESRINRPKLHPE